MSPENFTVHNFTLEFSFLPSTLFDDPFIHFHRRRRRRRRRQRRRQRRRPTTTFHIYRNRILRSPYTSQTQNKNENENEAG